MKHLWTFIFILVGSMLGNVLTLAMNLVFLVFVVPFLRRLNKMSTKAQSFAQSMFYLNVVVSAYLWAVSMTTSVLIIHWYQEKWWIIAIGIILAVQGHWRVLKVYMRNLKSSGARNGIPHKDIELLLSNGFLWPAIIFGFWPHLSGYGFDWFFMLIKGYLP